MTDNEIINILKQRASFHCFMCSFNNDEDCKGEDCEKLIAEHALDIINHQKAEIKELRSNESRWLILAAHLGRIEELRMKLFKLSQMNLEEIIEYFAKGYTLVPPEPPNFNELAKFAEEMTEDGNDKN